jgi:hypothetical protein
MHRLLPRALLVVALVAAAGLGTLAAVRTESDPAALVPQAPPRVFERGGVSASGRALPSGGAAVDVVTVFGSRDLRSTVAGPALAAANQAGAAAVIGEAATLGMFRVWRAGRLAAAAPAGYRYGLSTSAVPTDAVGRIMTRQIAAIISGGSVVVSQTTANLRGIRAGDVLDVMTGAVGTRPVRVGMVAADDTIGGTEMLMSPAAFRALGYDRPSRVIMWGFPDRRALDAALAAQGLVRPDVRILHSWDPPNPDSTLSTSQTKVRLGEFAYAGAGNSITPEAAWRAANIGRYSWPTGLGTVNTWCHRVVDPAARAALAEVARRGLGGAIDLANTNRYGGCYGPREVRPAGGTTGGSLSRHSWGQAIDMNTVSNCMGCVPRMHCTVVQIFRKYGFAWGGNFLTPDGMHFEWVGERRDMLSYPSRYCPNVAGLTQSTAPEGAAGAGATLPPAPAQSDSRHLLLAETSLGDTEAES